MGGVCRPPHDFTVPVTWTATSGTRSPGCAGRTLPCPAGGSRPAWAGPLGHQPGAGPQRRPPHRGLHAERAHQLAWQRQRRRSRLGWPLTRRCGRRCRSCWTAGTHPSRQREAQGAVPGRPAMRAATRRSTSRSTSTARGAAAGAEASLRSGRAARRRAAAARRPAGRSPPRSDRAAAAGGAGRLVPGHHEGDLVMGTVASKLAVAPSSSGPRLPHPAAPAGRAHRRRRRQRRDQPAAEYPAWFARTLTWDNGKEMARHARITSKPGSRSTR